MPRSFTASGLLDVRPGELTLDGAFLEDALADAFDLPRNEHGGVHGSVRVRITVDELPAD